MGKNISNSYILLYVKNRLIYYNLLILFIIIYYIIYISKGNDISNSISKIFLTINGTGNQRILSKNINEDEKVYDFNYIPDSILVNNISQNIEDKYVYNLTKQVNNIIITWNNQISNCSCMFYGLTNITKIDLSYFNTSLVTDMSYMFKGCSSLISLNINNFNTSLVNHMNSMFEGCSSLISLNLNNFNTSLVTFMNSMFEGGNSNLIYCINEIKENTITSLLFNLSNSKDCNNTCFINLAHKLIKEKKYV